MKDDGLDKLFAALAHPHRRRMLELLRQRPGLSVRELGDSFAMSDVGVLKHVRVLEAADLVLSRKQGRERHLFFNVMPIQAVYERWTDEYARFWAGQVSDLKERLESRAAERSNPPRKAEKRA